MLSCHTQLWKRCHRNDDIFTRLYLNKHESCVCCVSVGVVNENNLPKMSECKNNVKSLHKTAVNGHVGKNEAIAVASDSANSTNTAGTLALVVYLCPN